MKSKNLLFALLLSFTLIMPWPAFSGAKEKAQEAAAKAKAAAQKAKEKVEETVTEVKEAVEEKASDAQDKASETKETVKDAASQTIETVKNAVSQAKDAAKTKISETVGKVSDTISDIKESVTNGIVKPDDYTLNVATVSDESDIPLRDFPDGSTLPVKLQRLAYPASRAAKAVPGAASTGMYETNVNFPEWAQNGVSESHRADTYIAIVSEPDPSEVEHVVLIVSGQQDANATGSDGLLQPNGFPNALTGQGEKWRKNWPIDTPQIDVSADARSLAAKLNAQAWFPPEKTFMALVFDSVFYYDLSKGEQSNVVEAYGDWLMNKTLGSPDVRTIYLAGASRGGCLVARVAKFLMGQSLLASSKVYVSGFDAVCNDAQGELGTVHEKVYNPILYPDGKCAGPLCYYAFDADLPAYYGTTDRLRLFQIAGGGNVLPADNLAGNPRAFTFEDRSGATSWYLQKWVPYGHSTICRSYDADVVRQTIDSQLSWLEFHLEEAQ